MSTHLNDPAEAQSRLWDEIRKVRYGMLGLTGLRSGGHFQPMTAFCEPETGEIWFFTLNQTDLARATVEPSDAMFVIQAKDQAFQACLGGRLQQRYDRARMDRYWNPVVAAWYPEGKDDPSLTLLRFAAHDAQVWISEGGPVRFAWEIAKANLTGKTPDVGESGSLSFGEDTTNRF